MHTPPRSPYVRVCVCACLCTLSREIVCSIVFALARVHQHAVVCVNDRPACGRSGVQVWVYACARGVCSHVYPGTILCYLRCCTCVSPRARVVPRMNPPLPAHPPVHPSGRSHTHTHTHTAPHPHTLACVVVRRHERASTPAHLLKHVWVRSCAHVPVRSHGRVCTRQCVRAYVHIPPHTHTHCHALPRSRAFAGSCGRVWCVIEH